MDSDEENVDYADEIDEKGHEKLIENVLNLNKVQHVKKPSRTEPTLKVSEFNLVKSITGEKGSVSVNELTQVLKKRKSHATISKKIQSTSKKAQVLPKPLEKPQAERIRRAVGYEKNKLKLDKWEPIVTSNRVSTSLKFPLDDNPKIEFKEAKEMTKMWRTKSKLREELEKIEPKVEIFEIDIDKDKIPKTMREMVEHRNEMARVRALQSYKEAKARRQNKIKSKKYHRIQRRQKIKQQLKEFEELQKTNPEEALKKLEDIDRIRAEERFSLRHRSTSKWAKNKQIRAKCDKESREALAQQLAVSRELTQKLKVCDENSDDEEIQPGSLNEKASNITLQTDPNNPWFEHVKPEKEVVDFVSNYRRFWAEKNEVVSEKTENAEHSESTQEEDAAVMSSVDSGSKPKKRKSEEIIVNGIPKSEPKENLSKSTSSHTTGIDSDVDNNNLPKATSEESFKKEIIEKKGKAGKKRKTHKKPAGSTSEWEISNVDVEDIFQKLEDKLERKLKRKVKCIGKDIKQPKKKQKTDLKMSLNKASKKIDLKLPHTIKKPIIDEALSETTKDDDIQIEGEEYLPINRDIYTIKKILSEESESTGDKPVKNSKKDNVKSLMNSESVELKSALPDILGKEDDDEDDANQLGAIMDAFEDDENITDFTKEKRNEIDKDKPKDIDLTLPGWGAWTGPGIQVSKRKRRRFIIKMPKAVPRRDDNKGTLIINEKAQSKIKEHMVSEVPFPFNSVKDYEASLRAPIGRIFVPETAFRKHIKPAITTKMGTIIEPMSKDVLLNK